MTGGTYLYTNNDNSGNFMFSKAHNIYIDEFGKAYMFGGNVWRNSQNNAGALIIDVNDVSLEQGNKYYQKYWAYLIIFTYMTAWLVVILFGVLQFMKVTFLLLMFLILQNQLFSMIVLRFIKPLMPLHTIVGFLMMVILFIYN